MIDTRLSGLDYLEKEIRQEVESINPDNMTAMGHQNERSRGDSALRGWPEAEWHLIRMTADLATQFGD